MSDWRQGRRKTKEDRAKRPPRGPKLFHLRWKPQVRPMKLHFQRPEKPYEDRFNPGLMFWWLRGKAHWIPSARRVNQCSTDQCIVCAGANPQEFGLELQPNLELGKLEPKGFTAASGWIEEWFNLREKKREGGEGYYKVRELCEGRDCEGCRDNVPRVYGQRFYCAFSEAQWSNCIEPLMEKIERNCRCGGYLYPSHYGCRKCGEKLFDMTNSCPHCGDGIDVDLDPDTHSAECSKCNRQWSLLEYEDEKLGDMADSLFKCAGCGHEDYPKVKLICSNSCQEDGDPHDIYSSQIILRKDSDKDQYNLVSNGFKIQEPNPKLFDAQHQGGDDAAAKIVEYHKECLDLDKIMPLLAPHAQARELHMKNPWGDVPSDATHKRYSGTPGDRGSDE